MESPMTPVDEARAAFEANLRANANAEGVAGAFWRLMAAVDPNVISKWGFAEGARGIAFPDIASALGQLIAYEICGIAAGTNHPAPAARMLFQAAGRHLDMMMTGENPVESIQHRGVGTPQELATLQGLFGGGAR